MVNPFKGLVSDEEWNRLPDETKQYYIDVEDGQRALTLMNDYVFKKIFDPDVHSDRLSDLLSLILKQKIIKLHSVRNESAVKSIYSKKMIMDIVAQLENDDYYIVEMQVKAQDFIDKRLAVYSSDLLVRQYAINYNQNKKDVTFDKLKKVYTIVLMSNSPNQFKNNNYNLHHFKQTSDTGVKLDLLQEYVFIELGDFIKMKDCETVNNKLDAWLLFIATDDIKVKNELMQKYPDFKEAYIEALGMLRDRKELISMFAIDFEQIEKNSIREAGRIEGEKAGRKAGRKEERLEIAKNMLNESLSLSTISKLTRLPIEVVKELAKDNCRDISNNPYE